MSISKKNLFSKFELQGKWWLPNTPEQRSAGTLFVDGEDGLILELIGERDENDFFKLGEKLNPQIILGMTKEGPCTLYNNVQVFTGFSTAGIFYPKFSSQFLFFGEHFNSESELKFSSASINYTYLEEWIGTIPFTEELVTKEEKFVGWKSAFHSNDEFSVYVPFLDSNMSIFHGCSKKGGGFHSLTFDHISYLEIDPKKIRDFTWFQYAIFATRDLLSLFIGEPVYPKKIRVFIEREESEKSKPKSIDLFFKQKNKQINSNFHPVDIIVPLENLKGNIDKIFEAFFLSLEKLKPVYGLLLGTYYNPSPYIHFQFLNLMQALETFHRRTSQDDIYIPKSDYKKLRKLSLEPLIEQAFEQYKEEIKENPPHETDVSDYLNSLEDLKGLVIGRVSQSNSISLQTRVVGIFEELPTDIFQLITNNIDDFSRKLVKTRDDLTHYIEKKEKNILTGTEIYNAVNGLKILLTYLLLNELKIDKSATEDIILHTERFKGNLIREVEYDIPEIDEEKKIEILPEEVKNTLTEPNHLAKTKYKNRLSSMLGLIGVGIGVAFTLGNLLLSTEKKQDLERGDQTKNQ